MHVIVVYDVPAKRTPVYRKLLRKRLEHLQYSVFFGELTKGQLTALENEIDNKLQSDDSVVIFKSQNPASFEYSTFGSAEEPGSRFT